MKCKNGELWLNKSTVRQLLYSRETEKALTESAEPIKRRAGDGHDVETFRGHDRVRAVVKTSTKDSASRSLNSNNLLKAVGR